MSSLGIRTVPRSRDLQETGFRDSSPTPPPPSAANPLGPPSLLPMLGWRSGEGVARLQVQVRNDGSIPASSSPVAIQFFLRKITVTTAILDGGGLEPGELSRVLEFEIPQACLVGGCTFQVSVDPEKQVGGENRSNNLALGRCEGQATSQYVPTLGTPRP